MRPRSGIERIVDVRPGEWARTVLMFLTVLLLIGSYTMTKAVRDAVFLSHFGLTALSYMMIAIAIVAGVAVSAYKRLFSRVPRNVVALFTNCFVALTLVAMAIGLHHGVRWISWGLYFWSSIFGLVLVAEFWLLANDLFDAREAKRLFPLIGAGAILGGLCGGALASGLAKPLGTYNLLYLVAAGLVTASLLSHLAWRHRRPEVGHELKEAPPPRFAAGLAILRRNRYVRLIAMMLVCMTVAYTIVQWQYKGIAKAHFGGHRDQMTSFFGTFAALLNLGSFVLQLLGTPRLLRRFGLGLGLRVLPSGLGLGALLLLGTTLFPLPLLGAAAAAMLLCDGFRFSVDKVSTELLYLPITRAVKDQAKPFIDTFVDRAAGALAAFIWLFLTWAFHVDRPDRIIYASLATLAVVVLWLILLARAQAAYLEAYRQLLGAKAGPARRLADPQLRRRVEDELARLAGEDAPRRGKRLARLARMARRGSDLQLPPARLAPLLLREAEAVRRLMLARLGELAQVSPAPSLRRLEPRSPPPHSRQRCGTALSPAATHELFPTTRPLVQLLGARLAAALARLFDLLALIYPPYDVRAAQRGLQDPSPTARAGALELLDNVVRGAARHPVLAALELVVLPNRRPPLDREQTLAALLALDDPLLRREVARAARAEGILLAELDHLARSDPHPAVRQAALCAPSPLPA